MLTGVLAIEVGCGVEADVKVAGQQSGCLGVAQQGVRHELGGEAAAQLQQVVGVGTEDTNLLPRQLFSQNETVQAIRFALAQQVGVQCVLIEVSYLAGHYPLGQGNTEVIEQEGAAIGGSDVVGLLIHHDHAHVLHDRQQLGEGVGVREVGLEAGFTVLLCTTHSSRLGFGQGLKNRDVLYRVLYFVVSAVGGRHSFCPVGRCGAAQCRLLPLLGEGVFNGSGGSLTPGAGGFLQAAFNSANVHRGYHVGVAQA